MGAEYGFLQKLKVTVVVITVEELAIIVRHRKMPAEDFGIIDLEAIKTGETLHFDELGSPAAGAVFTYAEVEDQEMGVVVFIGDTIGGADRTRCPFSKSGFLNDVDDDVAGCCELGV